MAAPIMMAIPSKFGMKDNEFGNVSKATATNTSDPPMRSKNWAGVSPNFSICQNGDQTVIHFSLK
jgi:hypothetical protein